MSSATRTTAARTEMSVNHLITIDHRFAAELIEQGLETYGKVAELSTNDITTSSLDSGSLFRARNEASSFINSSDSE